MNTSPKCILCETGPSEINGSCGLCLMRIAAERDNVPHVYWLAERLRYTRADVMRVLRAANASRKAA